MTQPPFGAAIATIAALATQAHRTTCPRCRHSAAQIGDQLICIVGHVSTCRGATWYTQDGNDMAIGKLAEAVLLRREG